MAKYNKLAGKHIVVIGGSKGIGRGVVEAAIESGARVTLVGSSQRSADATVSSIKAEYPHAQLVGLGCDLSQPTIDQDLDALLTRAAELTGEIDHIVSTAADNPKSSKLEDITPEAAMKAAQMRFLAPIMVGKAAQKHLAAAVNGAPGTGKDKSLILTTGSVASKPNPGWSIIAYFAAGITGCKHSPFSSWCSVRLSIGVPVLMPVPFPPCSNSRYPFHQDIKKSISDTSCFLLSPRVPQIRLQ